MAALDLIAPLQEQTLWLEGGVANSKPSDRQNVVTNDSHDEALQRLKNSTYWSYTAAALRNVIEKVIFKYAETEKSWWSVTILRNGDALRINIGPQELLVLQPENAAFYVHCGNDLDEVTQTKLSILSCEVQPWDQYATKNQCRIYGSGAEVLRSLFSDDKFLLHLRIFSLRLMQAKRNIWGKAHSFAVVTMALNAEASRRYPSDQDESDFQAEQLVLQWKRKHLKDFVETLNRNPTRGRRRA